MLRQPMNRFAQMQATDIDIYRNEVRKTKDMLVGPLLLFFLYFEKSENCGCACSIEVDQENASLGILRIFTRT
jgi:hypothetical protein